MSPVTRDEHRKDVAREAAATKTQKAVREFICRRQSPETTRLAIETAVLRAATSAQDAFFAARFATRSKCEVAMAACAALTATMANDASEKAWLKQYVKDRVKSHGNHTALLDALGRRPDDDGTLWSVRGRLGIVCEGCGAIGQYRSTCHACAARQKNEPPSPAPCYFWGDHQQQKSRENADVRGERGDERSNAKKKKKEKGYLPSVKMSFTAGPAAAAASRGNGRHSPYQARSHGEANLHIVLHFATRCLRQFMSNQSTYAETVLREPDGVAVAPRENPTVFAEDRDVLLRKQPVSRRTLKAHEYLGYARIPDGDVDDMNDLWKRGPAFCFDRSQSTGGSRDAELLRNYAADPSAGKRNAHGFRKWLDPTSLTDRHVTSGRECAGKLKVAEARLRQQSAWTMRQQGHEATKREIYGHVVDLVGRELRAEAERQTKRMPRDWRQARAERAKIEQDRCEAADKIIRILVGHDMIKSIEEADYLIYANDVAQRGRRKKCEISGEGATKRKGSLAGVLGASTVDKTLANTTTGEEEEEEEDHVSFSQPEARVDEEESRSGALTTALTAKGDLRLYQATKRSGDYAHEAKTSQLERLAASGPGRLRKGKYSDDSTITPAVLPFPASLTSGGLSSPSSHAAGNYEKSAAAAAVLDAARARHKAKRCLDDSKKQQQQHIPLWCRMSDAGVGRRHYSEIFGQPMVQFSYPCSNPKKNWVASS